MKRVLLSVVCLLLCFFAVSVGNGMGQSFTASEQEEIIQRISSKTSSFKSIACDITQTRDLAMMEKPVVSKGRLTYQAPSSLRLDYTSPEAVSYIISGSSISIVTQGKKQTMDLSSSKKTSSMFEFIMTCVTGECISDRSSFSAEVLPQNGDYLVVLTPIKRDIRQMFSSLEIIFDGKTSTARTILMHERGDNSTTLVLSNVRTNMPVDGSIFN